MPDRRRLTSAHRRLIDAANASEHCYVDHCRQGHVIHGPEGVRIQVTTSTQPHAAAHALGLTIGQDQPT